MQYGFLRIHNVAKLIKKKKIDIIYDVNFF